MKIAFPTDDGKTISAHFGRAPFFVIADVNNDGSAAFERREKAYHGSQMEHDHHPEGGEEHSSLHQGMFGVITDCQVLIAGGMGEPAYEHAKEAGLNVVLTGEKDIQTAVKLFHENRLASDPRRIHIHR